MENEQLKMINEHLVGLDYATECHSSTNHMYDGKPYMVHIGMVVDVAVRFMHLIQKEDQPTVLSACFCHDVIEDTRQTYNDVVKVIGKDAAEIVYALTNEKGRTRKDRANSKYYDGILKCKYAVFVKLCDRIANVQYGKDKGSDMFEK